MMPASGLITGPIVFLTLVVSFFILAILAFTREQKNKNCLRAYRNSPQKLLREAETKFLQGQYSWTIKYLSQAKAAANDDTWQAGFPFLLGAQIALGQNDDAKSTRIAIIDSMQKDLARHAGYFASADSIHRLVSDLSFVKTEVVQDKMPKWLTGRTSTEIDLVIHEGNVRMHPGE
jgi:hypothetical protein